MAAPQVQEISIKSSNVLIISFDQAIDDSVNVPITCFSLNYGRVPVTEWSYRGTSEIVLKFGKQLKAKDKLEVNYQPPEDVKQALRAPVAANASTITMRRNAVRAFYKVPALNQIRPDESAWNEMANLGSSGDVASDSNPETGGGSTGWDDTCDNGSGGGSGASGGSGGTNSQTARYPNTARPNPRSATPDDFILAYGLREAIQLSNIDDGDASQPNTDKIWMAIQDACALIDNYIMQAGKAGKLLISSNRRRTALIIARYYLDSVRRREDVKGDYEQCLKELAQATSIETVVRSEDAWWADQCSGRSNNGIRSFRVPQHYNGVSGKGLSGWWTDSGYVESDDWRYDRYGSESNNDQGNWEGSRSSVQDDSRNPDQPTDDGGEQNSSNRS